MHLCPTCRLIPIIYGDGWSEPMEQPTTVKSSFRPKMFAEISAKAKGYRPVLYRVHIPLDDIGSAVIPALESPRISNGQACEQRANPKAEWHIYASENTEPIYASSYGINRFYRRHTHNTHIKTTPNFLQKDRQQQQPTTITAPPLRRLSCCESKSM